MRYSRLSVPSSVRAFVCPRLRLSAPSSVRAFVCPRLRRYDGSAGERSAYRPRPGRRTR